MRFLNKQTLLALLLLVVVSLPAIFPLFQKGFFQTDDGEWMIIRFSAFHQTLRDGEIPVRFLGRLNQEYGYPVANFLYPGFLYLAEPFHLVGFDFVESIKIILGLAIITSGIFTYLWLRKLFDNFSSFVGALFYVYTPYHLYDLSKRGSVGELLALAIVPFILWQVERRSILWSSLGIGLLVISHNTLAALFLPIIVIYLAYQIFQSKQKKSLLLYALFIFLFGLGLSAFFWIPAVFELQYTVFSKTTVANWNEYFAPLALIGYSSLLVLLLPLLSVSLGKIAFTKHRLLLVFSTIGIVSVSLSLSFSNGIWNILPVGFIQFPFRFLSVTIFCVAFVAAALSSLFKGHKKIVFGIALLVMLFASSRPFLGPTAYFDKGEASYATNMATTTVHDEYMPVWVKEKPAQRAEKKVEIIDGKGTIENIIANNRVMSFTVNNEKTSIIRIHTIYWPGWEAKIDGRTTDISYNNARGLIELHVPAGKHGVEVRFKETPLRLLSDVLSVGSFIALLMMSVLGKKKKIVN